jgi:putative transposase
VSGNLNHLGIDQLRRGRVSIPGARYFTTVCTQGRKVGLCSHQMAQMLLDEVRALEESGDLTMLAATVMPEHVHLLFTLGRRISLSQVHAKYKAKTRRGLSEAGLAWQDNFFDHRLREQVPLERFARYIFLNPYAKGIVSLHEAWPFWMLSGAYTPEFMLSLVNEANPPIEWLHLPDGAVSLVQEDVISRG